MTSQHATSPRKRVNSRVKGRLSIAHEHLASAAVIAIILETVRAVPAARSAPRVVVATPSGDHHALPEDVSMVIGGASAASMMASLGDRRVTLCESLPALRATFAREVLTQLRG